MEKIKNNEHNMVDDNDMAEVSAGGSMFDKLHALLFGADTEKPTNQTIFSDESGAWGSW